MNGFEHIIQQTELGKKAVQEMKSQTQNFENLLTKMVENAPEKDKKTVDQIRMMAVRAINLAKQGKGDEAQQIIKDFKDGSKNK